jgi:hypothetical protein
MPCESRRGAYACNGTGTITAQCDSARSCSAVAGMLAFTIELAATVAWEVGVMLENFFKLPGTPVDINEDEFLKLTKSGGEIRGKIYLPNSLESPSRLRQTQIVNCKFVEVSFSKTWIEGIEFSNCSFTDCLFIGTVFKDCRFTNCTFTGSNTYRIKFIDVFLNPRSFDKCLDKKRHQNIGLHLYQELLNNSRRQSQPDFAHDALFQFRRWNRFENIYRFRRGKISWAQFKLLLRIVLNWSGQTFLGFGVRLRNYFFWVTIAALVLTTINYSFAANFGLMIGQTPLQSFTDAFYFTIITLTTVGYGDITPTIACGRFFIAFEGFVGFVLLATLASMIYRKMLP